jgi:hypothetical protein
MSELPSRLLLKNSQCSSRDSEGAPSFAAVLMIVPRFSGGPHGSCTEARLDTQMSFPPADPSRRVELK